MYKLIILILSLSIFLSACNKGNTPNPTESSLDIGAWALSESKDMGADYIDDFIFLGESTTYHLKSRGVLSGGTHTTQVWAPKSGTLMLDPSTSSCRIIYPETGEELDLCVAMAQKKPKYMLLTFGLNGASKCISKGSQYFKSCYSKLISALQSASPDTVILLQSCFPIGKDMDMSAHSIDSHTLNEYIDLLNVWTCELALELSLPYLNSAQVLKDTNGFLKKEFQMQDGYHLTKEAYIEILKYIRTHAYLED